MAPIFAKIEHIRKTYLIIIPLLAVFLTGCYQSDDVQSFRKNTQGEQMFSFYDYRDGKETHWKVYFKDDSISALYKNGRRIPDSEVKNYSEMIYDKIDDIADLRGEREKDIRVYKFDGDHFKMNMDRMKHDMKHMDKDIRIKVDKDLKDGMKKLHIEMNKLKEKGIPGPEFNEEMKKLQLEMKSFHNDSTETFVYKFDGKELEDELENLANELKDVEINIDIPEIEINLDEVDKNLGDIDVELKDIDKDLKNLDNFFEELKSEMVKDKLINSKDEEITLRLEKDKMYVNDKEVPAETYQKYKELYKKYTGKDFEENHYFHFNNE